MTASHKRDPEFQTAAERQASQSSSPRLPRILVIGAGQRGYAYATAIQQGNLPGVLAAVAEPVARRREAFGKRFIWPGAEGHGPAREDQAFDSWQDFIRYETARREVEVSGARVFPGFDGVFICTQDRTHESIVRALAPLKLHVMCEKPLASTLADCRSIFASLTTSATGEEGRTGGHSNGASNGSNGSSKQSHRQRTQPNVIFSIGHVLRYSPHNMLLRKLLLEERIIGELISIEHTEPVGWWHFSHSFVRGNWRREDTSGPVLLTKSCHDIDFVLWLLCYRGDSMAGKRPIHMPSHISSTGNLSYFTRRRKPKAAGQATNCLSCPHEPDCNYSAKKIYLEKHFDKGDYDWPVDVLVPEIEDIVAEKGVDEGRKQLTEVLSDDYDASVSDEQVRSRTWYGRCVWETDNNVLDDQIVTLQWDGDKIDSQSGDANDSQTYDRGPKTAVLHMVANTEKQCERRGWISGTLGEIHYDSYCITVHNFGTNEFKTYEPKRPGGGHGGGDAGLAGQFLTAVGDVINGRKSVVDAQREHIGCTLEEAFMSHAMVFAADEARKERKVVDWEEWWEKVLDF